MSCGNQPQPPKTCPLKGAPVNPILGCKILTENPDVYIDAHLPLVLRRTYASDEGYESMLGQGWSFDFGYRLEVLDDRIVVYDSYGKKDNFPLLNAGQSALVPKGAMEVKKTTSNTYVVSVKNRFYHFEAHEGVFRLMRMTDNNDNAIRYFYEEGKRFASFIALDNHRVFKLLGNTHRILGLEELTFDKTTLSKNLLEVGQYLILIHYTQENERLRVGSIESFKNEEKIKKKLYEDYTLHNTEPATLKPLVRYVYSKENDLIEVYGLENVLLRTFSYRNHVMISHGVPEGLESFYEYSQYNPQGKVLKNTTNTHQVWDFSYKKNETLVKDALGRETVYRFDDKDYFSSKLDALHQEMTMQYDGNGQLIEIKDVSGKVQTFNYDDKGMMTSSVATGRASIHYTPHYRHPHKPMHIETHGKKTTLNYDRRGNLIEERLPNNKTITYTRDVHGNPVEIHDAFGGVSTLSYNLSGNLTKHINPLGEVTTLAYDDNENLIALTDIEKNTTHYDYNTHNKLIQVIHPDNSTESYAYNPQGKLLSHTDSFNATSYYTTDKASNLVEIKNPHGKSTHFKYDVEGRLEIQIDPLGQETQYLYDPLDRVIATKEAKEHMLVYAYTEHNTLKSLIDPVGNTTSYTYDAQGNVSTQTYPNTQVKTLNYAPTDSLPTRVKNTNNAILFFDHNSDNQPTLIAGNDVKIMFTYNSYKQLQSLINNSHSVALSYDLLGELQTQTQDSIAVSQIRETHSYNTTLSYLNQSTTTTHYSKDKKTTLQHNTNKPIVLSYDIQAKTQTTTYPNGKEEHYVFNDNKELIKLYTPQETYHYQRDALGRITQIQTNDTHTQYSYDALGQVIKANSQTFSYDKAGNNQHNQATYNTSMNQLQEDAHYTYTYSYDTNGNLQSKIDKQTQEMLFYRYNDLNQLIEHYKATKEDTYIYRLLYTYDGFNRRITKTYIDSTDNTKEINNTDKTNSYAHQYLYHEQNIVAILDLNKNKQLLASIVHHPTQIDTPLSITNHNTNKTYYYHRNHLGSIIALSNQDAKIVEEIHYDSHYGVILNHSQEEETFNPYGYTGRETDTKELYYYRARYYDPTLQRFLSRDPIEFEAGDFNFYRYVGGDCVNFRDPSGLDPLLNGKGVPSGMGGNANKNTPSADQVKIYGNWCGPGLTGGYYPYAWGDLSDNQKQNVKAPTDKTDTACAVHDVTYDECRKAHPCDKTARAVCMQQADRILASSIAENEWGRPWMIRKFMKKSTPDGGENPEVCCE